ncbi:MAG: ribonuclease domain-containing protein [Blautia sp.]
MRKKIKYLLGLFLLLCTFAAGCTVSIDFGDETASENPQTIAVQENTENAVDTESPADSEEAEGSETEKTEVSEFDEYTSKEQVAAYIHIYGHLPENYITKKEAKKLGWVSSEGNLSEVAPGKSIGGDYFGNYEGSLPEKEGRNYYECDIDSDGGYRGAKRIVYSDDGLIYYTEDHYETFELLYGEE